MVILFLCINLLLLILLFKSHERLLLRHLRVLIRNIVILLAEELRLLLGLLGVNLVSIGMGESHLRRAVEENLLGDYWHWISQRPQLMVTMCEAAEISVFARSVHFKILANLSFVVAMHRANILFSWESLRQRVFDAPFLIVTMGKRACISQSTRIVLFPMPTHRCLVLHVLLLTFVLGLVRIPD